MRINVSFQYNACIIILSSHWKKLMLGYFSFLSQIFPRFPSLFHMFIDTMILSFNQSFQYHWFTDNMAVLNFAITLQVQK